MNKGLLMKFLYLTFFSAAFAHVSPAEAYIGPGVGIGTLGIIIGIIGSLLLAIFAVVFFPIRRLIRKIKSQKDIPAKKDNQEK